MISAQAASRHLTLLRLSVKSFKGRSIRAGFKIWTAHAILSAESWGEIQVAYEALVSSRLRRVWLHWTVSATERRRRVHTAALAVAKTWLRWAWIGWTTSRGQWTLVSRAIKSHWQRRTRGAFTVWVLVSYSLHAEWTLHQMVRRRTASLEAALIAQQSEVDKLRSALEMAVSTVEVARVEVNKEAYDRKLEQHHAHVEKEAEIQAALDEQREQMLAAAQLDLEHAKQVWAHQLSDYERQQEQKINALQMKLGLTQTSVCRLLVDRAGSNEQRMLQRMANPPPALHSLAARARADRKPMHDAGARPLRIHRPNVKGA